MSESVREYEQLTWNQQVQQSALQLVQMALQEDLGDQRDWSTWASIAAQSQGAAHFVNRVPGVVAGLPVIPLIIQALKERDSSCKDLQWKGRVTDGTWTEPGTILGTVSGSTRTLLQMERTALNFLGRLSGIATLTHQFASRIQGTGAHIYDTRKTTPGWRLLEKYAVRCGGGKNHRLGLYAAVMLKDNHLAADDGNAGERLIQKIQHTHHQLDQAIAEGDLDHSLIFEVEVDQLSQLEAIIDQPIDIVLLDNMSPDLLRQAVALRNQRNPKLQLEASGGVHLGSVAEIAATGVERISSGALTHSAVNWDVGLDWVRDE